MAHNQPGFDPSATSSSGPGESTNVNIGKDMTSRTRSGRAFREVGTPAETGTVPPINLRRTEHESWALQVDELTTPPSLPHGQPQRLFTRSPTDWPSEDQQHH